MSYQCLGTKIWGTKTWGPGLYCGDAVLAVESIQAYHSPAKGECMISQRRRIDRLYGGI